MIDIDIVVSVKQVSEFCIIYMQTVAPRIIQKIMLEKVTKFIKQLKFNKNRTLKMSYKGILENKFGHYGFDYEFNTLGWSINYCD